MQLAMLPTRTWHVSRLVAALDGWQVELSEGAVGSRAEPGEWRVGWQVVPVEQLGRSPGKTLPYLDVLVHSLDRKA